MMAKRTPPKAKFVKAGQACPVGWRKKIVMAKGGRRQELCVGPKK
jgi:hypothetical protein